MKYIVYLVLAVVALKIYDKLFLKYQLKKALKNKRISYKEYQDFIPRELSKTLHLKNFTLKSEFVCEKMEYQILYPINFDRKKTYNILYMLHGLRDVSANWILKAKLGEIYYDLLEKGEIEPMIIVLPESGSEGRSWYSDWVGIPKRAYEQYFINELIPHAENNLNIKNRGISGFSMGGYGALKLSLKHLGIFQSVSSFAGAINFPRFFITELKGLGLFRHLKVTKFMAKSEDSRHFSKVFGGKLKFFRNENVYNLLRKVCKHRKKEVSKIHFLLSVGEKDNNYYTMVYQWTDVIGEMEKRNLNYKGHLVKNEEHTWSYVEKELPSILKFHWTTFKGENYEKNI